MNPAGWAGFPTASRDVRRVGARVGRALLVRVLDVVRGPGRQPACAGAAWINLCVRILALVRWLTVLCVLTVLTGAVSLGVVEPDMAGLARLLFETYAGLLGLTVVFALLRGF